MKYLGLFILLYLCSSLYSQTPAVDIEGDGMLLPRLSNTERDAISSPQEGLLIYNTDSNCMEIYRGIGWYSVCDGGSYVTGNPNRLYGGNGDEEPLQIIESDNNSLVIAGFSDSSNDGDVVDNSNGLEDYWVVKTNPIGDTLWTALLGGAGIENALAVTESLDGGYLVVGQSTSSQDGDVSDMSNGAVDFWIAKLDSDGSLQWNKLLGGSGVDIATSITPTLDDGFVIAGTATSSMTGDVTDISNGMDDYWVVKIDDSGNAQWNNLLGGPSRDVATSVTPTIDSGFVVAGTVVLFGGGDITGSVAGDSDAWVIKLDKNGSIVWNRLLGGNGQETAASVMSTSDGGFIVAGSSNSTSGNVSNVTNGMFDFYIAKLNSSGTKIWDKLIGGDEDDEASSIIQTSDGGYVVAGRSKSSMTDDVTDTSNGMFDFWVVRLDSNGNIIWNNLVGGSADDEPSSIIQPTDGGFIITGRSLSSITGDVFEMSNGMFDYWVIKLDADGNVIN